jgi:hypothetical protein
MTTKSILYPLVILSLLTVACGKETDNDKVADAQSCLDTATAADADYCVSKVDGIETANAYLIRCAGKFVKEGFNDPTKLSTALSNLSGDSTGASGSTAMMAALTFKAETTSALNSTSAQQALVYCQRANSTGLILLAGLTQTATVLADLGLGTTTLDGAALQTLMGTLQNDPAAQAAVGTAVVSMYESNCLNNSQAPGNYCQQFETAVSAVPGGVSDPSAVGQQIMICYNAPTTPGCTGF